MNEITKQDRDARAMESLPYSDQERLVKGEPVEVLVLKETGPETIMIPAKDLSAGHAAQVFSGGSIRTLPEQRSYLEAVRAKVSPIKSNGLPYTVEDSGIRIIGPCYLSFRELRKIMKREKAVA